MEAEGNTSVLYRCPRIDGVSIAVGYRRFHTRNTIYHTGMYEVWVGVWGMGYEGRNKYISERLNGQTNLHRSKPD